MLGTLNSWVLPLILKIGGDAYVKKRFFSFFFDYNHSFTYSITFCSVKLKEHLTHSNELGATHFIMVALNTRNIECSFLFYEVSFIYIHHIID